MAPMKQKGWWKREFPIDDLFSKPIKVLQLGGHWPVDYSRVLPASWAHLSQYINYVVFFTVTFMSWHMAVLHLTKLTLNIMSDEEVPIPALLDSFMSGVLHLQTGLGSFFLQYYHKECKELIERMNEKFRRRSSPGKY